MGNSSGLINLGDLTKPATVLIEKISDAIGGIFRPHQIRRIAEAQATADRITAVSQIEISELQRRATVRFVSEEAKKQQNIESITGRALPLLSESAKPEGIEDDWITNFFDKCRLISDEEMRALWSKVLAGEANAPGRFSKRTINVLSSLDKTDAELFRALCSFQVVSGIPHPLIYDFRQKLYADSGLNFASITHLAEIGLVTVNHSGGFRMEISDRQITLLYFGERLNITFPKESENELHVGYVLLSKAGKDLALVSGAEPKAGFVDYIIQHWESQGIKVVGRGSDFRTGTDHS